MLRGRMIRAMLITSSKAMLPLCFTVNREIAKIKHFENPLPGAKHVSLIKDSTLVLTLVLLNCLFLFFVYSKFELLIKYPTLNDKKNFLIMKNRYLPNVIPAFDIF